MFNGSILLDDIRIISLCLYKDKLKHYIFLHLIIFYVHFNVKSYPKSKYTINE